MNNTHFFLDAAILAGFLVALAPEITGLDIHNLKFIMDSALPVSMVTVMVSGLMILRAVLPALGWSVFENPTWEIRIVGH